MRTICRASSSAATLPACWKPAGGARFDPGKRRKSKKQESLMTAERPNIVLIMCDQMRWDAAGFAGSPTVRTPNLDRLAASGVCFENAYCASPVCSPARASWLTGLYSHAHLQLRELRPRQEGGVRCLPAGRLRLPLAMCSRRRDTAAASSARGTWGTITARSTASPTSGVPIATWASTRIRCSLFRTGRGAQPVSLRRAGYDSVREHPRVRHASRTPGSSARPGPSTGLSSSSGRKGCPVLPVCERKGSASPNPGTARAAGELPRGTDAAVLFPEGSARGQAGLSKAGGSSAFTPR